MQTKSSRQETLRTSNHLEFLDTVDLVNDELESSRQETLRTSNRLEFSDIVYEENNENETFIETDDVPVDDDENVKTNDKRKFNFSNRKKAKVVFNSSKNLEKARIYARNLRATPKGKEKSNETDSKSKQNIRATPDGRK